MKEETIKKGLIYIQYCSLIIGLILSLKLIYQMAFLMIEFINAMAIIVLESAQTPELRFLMYGTIIYLLSGITSIFFNIVKYIVEFMLGKK